VQAGTPASFALRLDLRTTALADDLSPGSPVHAWLALDGQRYTIQGAAENAARWQWQSAKTLAATSQPLVLHMQQAVRAAMLPGAACWAGWRAAPPCSRRCASCCASAWRAGAPSSCCSWARWRA
jgi:hypothetical protein